MVILIFLQISFNNNIDLEFAYPLINLAALHPGFLNPAEGQGVVGMAINPAAINEIDHGSFFISYSPSIRTEFTSNFIIPVDTVGSILDTVSLPVDFSFEDHGSFDYLGFGIRRGRWAFGLGFLRGDYLRIGLGADAGIDIEHSIEFADTLTSELIESLPVGVEIPVTIRLNGSGNANFLASGEGKLQSHAFILGAGIHDHGLDFGFGLQFEPVWFNANLDGNLAGGLAAAASASINSQSPAWTVDAQFEGEIYEDSLLAGMFETELKGMLVRFVAGFKKNFKFLDVGLSYHYLFPPSFNGNLSYQYLYPRDLPEIEIIDDSLHIDTINYRITGSGKIIIKDFVMDKDEEHEQLKYPFSKAHGLYAGVGLKLFFLKLAGFAGGLVIPDGSYARMLIGANLGLKIFIPIEGTITYSYQAIKVEEIPVTALPVIGANVGTNFKIRDIHFYLGGGINSTQGAATLVLPDYIEGQKTTENIISLRAGVGYEF